MPASTTTATGVDAKRQRAAHAEAVSPHDPNAARLDRVRKIAGFLDTRFRVPGLGVHFGFDALIGLVPVVGDSATLVLGLYPVTEAVRAGVPRRVIAKMLGNLAIDWLLGLVPMLDLFFDVAFKANVRNLRLLEKALAPPAAAGA